MSRKIWMRLSETPGRGAFQGSGTPAALIALTVKKTSAERLRIVVTIAMKLLSILKRLKKRRTMPLCSARAVMSPAVSRAVNAIRPRKET